MAARTSDQFGRFDGMPGAAICVYQSPGANAVAVAKQLNAHTDELAQRSPEDPQAIGIGYNPKKIKDPAAIQGASIDDNAR